MNEAIKLAIAKGGYEPFKTLHVEYYADWMLVVPGAGGTAAKHYTAITQDPLFWQSLGKALGNKAEMICDSPKCDSKLCEYAGYKDPKQMFDGYMECIWYGYDMEKFWRDVLH